MPDGAGLRVKRVSRNRVHGFRAGVWDLAGRPRIQDGVVNDAVELSCAVLQGLEDVHRLNMLYVCASELVKLRQETALSSEELGRSSAPSRLCSTAQLRIIVMCFATSDLTFVKHFFHRHFRFLRLWRVLREEGLRLRKGHQSAQASAVGMRVQRVHTLAKAYKSRFSPRLDAQAIMCLKICDLPGGASREQPFKEAFPTSSSWR